MQMIINKSQTIIVSNLGWVDKNRLWIFSIPTGKVSYVPVGNADWVGLSAADGEHFVAWHGSKNDWDRVDKVELTIHSFEDPSLSLARLVIKSRGESFEGEKRFLEKLRGPFVAALGGHYYLFLIDPDRQKVDRQELNWFEKQYDTMYQSIQLGAEIPQSELLLLSVQRTSAPLLYDPKQAKVVKTIELNPGMPKGGTPKLHFSKDGMSLWAEDYDTLVKLNASDWEVLQSLKLQEGDAKASGKFIGDFYFNSNESVCAVARPFSGDVAIIDTDQFKVVDRVNLGDEPLQIVLLDDGRVFSRGWHTGELLKGSTSYRKIK
jgi:hypothetical protein